MKAFKAFIKPFEAPQRSVKIKIQVIFFSLSGIVAGRVNVRIEYSAIERIKEINHISTPHSLLYASFPDFRQYR